MNIQSYVESELSKVKHPIKIKSDIAERWNSRVLARGLNAQGRNGARAYLDSYGRGIAAPKIVALALCAHANGAAEMAAGFWEAAFNLETGQTETLSVSEAASEPNVRPVIVGVAKQVPVVIGLPADLQPGRIVTMQPTDAPRPQSYYILNPDIIGSAKRDGHHDVLLSLNNSTVHQTRRGGIAGDIHPDFEKAASAVAGEIGVFILDGERYFLDAAGKEFRTSSEAAASNIEMGEGGIAPIPVYAAFKALFAEGRDLRPLDEVSRIKMAETIVSLIQARLPEGGPRVELVPTAYSTKEKQALADRQKAEGREGEVWVLASCQYSGGDSHEIVRTKYKIEEDFFITDLAPTTVKGRLFSSIEVADAKGNPVGSVGGGFDSVAMKIIADLFYMSGPGKVKIKVRFQSWTVYRQISQAVYLDLA